MHTLLALFLIAVCLLAIWQAVRSPNPLHVYSAVVGLFSIAYYGVPTVLIERSTLRYLPENELIAMISMALIYLLAVLLGISVFQARFKSVPGVRMRLIDHYIETHWWKGTIASNLIVFLYSFNRVQTFYQTDSVENFIDSQSSLAGFLGFIILLIQGLTGVYLARAIAARDTRRIAVAAAGILIQTAMVITAGQRLIFITPALLVFAALVAQRSYREAGSALVIAVVALLAISPFAVALRYGAWNGTQDVVAESFTYGENPIDTMLQSIVDRADILETMTALKAHVDANGHVGPIYYYSVLVVPVPRFLYRSKPAILSGDGSRGGEASVLVWRLLMGPSLGSLTAFGSIVAYREGGWLWVPINGFLAGMMYSLLLTTFSRGGIVAHAFFGIAFFRWAVAKVSPSLMEMMVDVMTYLPVIAVLLIINRLLEGQKVVLPDSDQVWDDQPGLSRS